MYKYKNKDVLRIYRGGSLLYERPTGTLDTLFKNNEQGFFYDPNDLSTMFQDAEGTVPVTAAGQPVGLILDKSGRNNHASQTNSERRPILRKNATTGANYLEFDGVDDFLVTDSVDFTVTDKVSLFAGVTKLADTTQYIAALDSTSSVGTFTLLTGQDGYGNGYSSIVLGSATTSVGQFARNYTYPAPDVAVLSVRHDISGDLSSMRRNGVVGIEGVEDKGTGNFGNYPLFIGSYLGLTAAFNGHIYSLIGVGRLVSEDETTAIEKELAKQVGVELITPIVEPMLVTPSDFNISISSVSDLEIDWGDGTIQTVKSGDDTTLDVLGLTSNKYTHTYTDSYIDKIISVKHLDGESPIQYFSSDAIKTVHRWYSEGHQPVELLNPNDGLILNMTFYGLGPQLETVPNIAPPKTTVLSGLFHSAAIFNQDLSGWDVSNVTSLSYTFTLAKAFNQDLSDWCVAEITEAPLIFATGATLFTEDKHPVWGTCPRGENLGDNESILELQEGTFTTTSGGTLTFANGSTKSFVEGVSESYTVTAAQAGKTNFKDTSPNYVASGSSLVKVSHYPFNATTLKHSSSPNLVEVPSILPSNVTSLSGAFSYCDKFNSPNVSDWDVSNVTNMDGVFTDCFDFVQPLNNWNVSNVTTMAQLLYGCYNFNQPLDNWDVSKVTDMSSLFANCASFNQDISGWDVSNVTSFYSLLWDCYNFNQPLGKWNTVSATNMESMFYNLENFDQDLSQWCVPLITTLPSNFNSNATLLTEDKLPVWGTCPRGENTLTT